MSENRYIENIRSGKITLSNIPAPERTQNICLAAVQRDGDEIWNVPDKMRTYEIYLAAMKSVPELFHMIPVDMRTEEVYESYVENTVLNGLSAFSEVPTDKQTEAIRVAALRSYAKGSHDTDYKEALGLAAVEKNPDALQLVPVDKYTETVGLAAVKKDEKALQFVPKNHYTKEICLAAVHKNRNALRKYIPADKLDFLTDEVCIAVAADIAKKKGWRKALESIPPSKHSEKLYLSAVKQDGNALKFIDQDKYTEAIGLAAVKQNPGFLEDVPENKYTEAVGLAAVKQHGYALQLVPIDKYTNDVGLAAVRHIGTALEFVPEDQRNDEICIKAIEQSGLALEFIPKDKLKLDLCLKAVEQNGGALEFVPEDLRDKIIQTLSVHKILLTNYLASQYFPKDIYNKEKNDFLSNITHVIANNSPDDKEVRDSQYIYINQKKDKNINNNSVLIMSNNDDKVKDGLKKLLTDLSTTVNKNELKLVLIGHSNEEADNLAGLDVSDIANICSENKNIKQVNLLGCKTAQASQTEMEREVIKKFGEQKTQQRKDKYGVSTLAPLNFGLMTALEAPNKNKQFQDECKNYCNKYNLNGVYVVNKVELAKNTYKYEIISMKLNKDLDEIQETSRKEIPSGRSIMLSGKQLAFPNPKNKPKNASCATNAIRGKDSSLNLKELDSIRKVSFTDDELKHQRFDRAHPKYKKDKSNYLLSKIKADPSDLTDSLLKKLVTEIYYRDDIKQKIELLGNTEVVSVDPSKKQFNRTKENIYKDNNAIDYKKLEEDTKHKITRMKDSYSAGLFNHPSKHEPMPKSMAGKISVTIKPKK